MNVSVEKRIGENIRKLRLKAGFTQEMVAAKLQVEGCDITRSALAKMEVGQRHIYPDELILLKRLDRNDCAPAVLANIVSTMAMIAVFFIIVSCFLG